MNFFSRSRERTVERLEVATEIGPVTVAVRRHARARSYSLRITGPGLPPVLTLPQRGSVRAAREFLERHAEWLARQMKKAPRTRPIADGTTIPLRGVEHRIRHVAGRRGTVTPMNGEDGPELLVFGEKTHLKRRVIDFLNVGVGGLRTGIFNVADIAVMVGVALLAWSARRRKLGPSAAT